MHGHKHELLLGKVEIDSWLLKPLGLNLDTTGPSQSGIKVVKPQLWRVSITYCKLTVFVYLARAYATIMMMLVAGRR